LVPCGRLSWLLVSFWAHVNIVHHIISYISKCMPCFVHFCRFSNCKYYWNRLRFDRVALKCTLLRFMNHGKNVNFNFSRYGAYTIKVMWEILLQSHVEFLHHKSDIKTKNRLRLAKVIVKNKLPRFLWITVYCAHLFHTILHKTDLIIFPVILQTIIIAPMMSIWGEGANSAL